MKHVFCAGAALLAALLVLQPATAQDAAKAAQIKQQIQQIEKNLDELATVLTSLGKEQTVQTIIKQQAKAEPLVLTFKLDPGDKRKVVAFCNPDCEPVEIKVVDAMGKEIGDDKDHPAIANFVAEVAGDHKATIIFTGCKTAACDVGVFVRARVR